MIFYFTGRQTRSQMAPNDYPHYEFVEWYNEHKQRKPNLLDVFEQWWINKFQSRADKRGFNHPKQSNLPEEVVHHFYNLATCDASEN